ncbi:MAG: SMC-Scp complex subunit ScpB [Gammaproteobacteria bacterium]|nr:SMC-Scp complex subunit ScpB [Gammaproteobacteria bacterium]
MTLDETKNILEAILLSAEKPMSVEHLDSIFDGDEDRPTRDDIRKALHDLTDEYAGRSFELKQVASGFRIQVKQDYAPWVGRLWEEKPARYTRALLETMALVAYRQPITRGEIEEVRGVSVSSNIIRTLQERSWIKVLGHKDVPGKPALYGTTREFLDYFNLTSLDELPTLAAIKDLDKAYPELALGDHVDELDDDAEAVAESEEGEVDAAAAEQLSENSEAAEEADEIDALVEADEADEANELVDVDDEIEDPEDERSSATGV